MFRKAACRFTLLIASLLIGMPAATARNAAATVRLVDGPVTLIAADKSTRTPRTGDILLEGDALITGVNAEAHLDMADGGFMAIRPDTRIEIREYRANGMDDDRSVIGLLKGSLRSITGWIGASSPRNYVIQTPSATIGVRGTEHETAFIPEDIKQGEPGTYDTVISGRTVISNEYGSIEVAPNRAGFAAIRGKRPGMLRQVPGFLRKARKHDGRLIEIRKRLRAEIGAKRIERRKQFLEEERTKGQHGLRGVRQGVSGSGGTGEEAGKPGQRHERMREERSGNRRPGDDGAPRVKRPDPR